MSDREKNAQKSAREMNKREDIYRKESPPTKEQAKKLVEQKRTLEKKNSRIVPVHKPNSGTTTKGKYTSSPIAKKPNRAHTPSKKSPATKPSPTIKKNATKKAQTSRSKVVRKSHEADKKQHESKKKKSFISKRNIYIISSILLFTLITSTVSIFLLKMGRQRVEVAPQTEFVSLEILNGMNATQIATLLESHQIIDNADSFVEYLIQKHDEGNLLSGTYNFKKLSSNEEVRKILTQKNIEVSSRITIFKGATVRDIDNQLTALQLIKSGDFIKALEKEKEIRHLSFIEGWIYSDVYIIDKGPLLASTLASLVIDRLYDFLREEMESIDEIDYSIDEIIIIASMIQRETQDASQMPDIAQVIYNRLKRNEPLGIDATTRYKLDIWNRELERKDFSASGEYDTRKRIGLPPTGIGSVGKESLQAALRPANHNYLYYFHDSEGNLHLSLTYEEHKGKYEELSR